MPRADGEQPPVLGPDDWGWEYGREDGLSREELGGASLSKVLGLGERGQPLSPDSWLGWPEGFTCLGFLN